MSRRRRGARLRSTPKPGAWLQRHLQVFFSSLGRLWQRPLGNAMSILVIAIAVALPAGLHLLVQNLEQLTDDWRSGASATLFLRQGISDDQVRALLKRLQDDQRLGGIEHLTPRQALAEFEQYSGMADAVSLLQENPLPHVILLRPARADMSVNTFRKLVEEVRHYPGVDRAIVDLQWVNRFQGMVQLVRRGSRILAALLSLAVLLVIGNTIRLEIQGRQQEIEIVKLVGGSRAFIRRPYLYEGFWYGLLGGLLAILLLALSLLMIQGPVAHLASLYGSHFQLQGLDPALILTTLGISVLLGVAGAWLAVQQQLDRIEPA